MAKIKQNRLFKNVVKQLNVRQKYTKGQDIKSCLIH